MKTNVNLSDFRDAFKSHNRENFSHAGLEALFDYLEEYEESTGEEVEFDVIALCCEYAEYENLAEFQEAYNDADYACIEDIAQQTTVIPINEESFIIQQF